MNHANRRARPWHILDPDPADMELLSILCIGPYSKIVRRRPDGGYLVNPLTGHKQDTKLVLG
jgi:hypothetical protein